jgi:cytochrome b pre-mRNA-processing protein 3
MFTPPASARVRVLDVHESRKFQRWLAMAERPDNPMILAVFRRRQPEATIRALYGTIVAQARHPSFYLSYGVPDSTTGRFEMIVLHQTLLLRRLRLTGASDHRGPLGQAVFDLFCRDMDHNLREMGVGDMAVPKEMRRMGEAFYGRAAAYDHALDTADERALAVALARNVLGEATVVPDGARRLARYVWEAVRRLAATSEASLAQAMLAFPDPDTITAAVASNSKEATP